MLLLRACLRRAAPVALMAFALASPLAQSADPCDGFTWPVAPERELFAGRGIVVAAARDADTAPVIDASRLYTVRLATEPRVSFVVAPSKNQISDAAHAGIVRFEIRQPGRYRVSASDEIWIEIIVDGQLVPSRDFHGIQGCTTPHKIVEYDLPRAGVYLLQLNGSMQQSVGVTLTPAPSVGD